MSQICDRCKIRKFEDMFRICTPCVEAENVDLRAIINKYAGLYTEIFLTCAELEKVLESYKKLYDVDKELIIKLEAENAELKKKLKEAEKNLQGQLSVLYGEVAKRNLAEERAEKEEAWRRIIVDEHDKHMERADKAEARLKPIGDYYNSNKCDRWWFETNNTIQIKEMWQAIKQSCEEGK